MNTAHKQCGAALPDFHRALPIINVVVHCTTSTSHSSQAVWRCIVGIPLRVALRQCGSSLHEFHGPLPQGSVVVLCKFSIAQFP